MIKLVEIEVNKIIKRSQTKIILCILLTFYLMMVIFTKYFHSFDLNFVVENSFSTLQFFPIALIIFTTSSMAIEYQTGTIKTLIYNTEKRYKIIFSKLLALIIVDLAMYLIILIMNSLIIKFLFFKLVPFKVVKYSVLWILGYVVESFYLISLTFLLAIIFDNQAISVSISIIVYFLANLIDGSIFSAIRNVNFLKYIPVNLFNFKMELVSQSMVNQTQLTVNNYVYLFVIYVCINVIFSIVVFSFKDL